MSALQAGGSSRQSYCSIGSLASARAEFGDDAAFDIAWSEGRAMSLDQAVKYALELDAGGDKITMK